MAKRKGIAEAKAVEGPKPIRPKLSDFETGIVPAVKWGLALKTDTKAIEKIRHWIKLGELVCPTDANPDPIIDVLILASAIKKGPPPDEETTPPASPAATVSRGKPMAVETEAEPITNVPRVDLRSKAEKLWDSWPQGWQKTPLKCPAVQAGTARQVIERILDGAKVLLHTSDGIREVRVSPDGGLAVVWWDTPAGQTCSMCFRWESIEAAIQAGVPLKAR